MVFDRLRRRTPRAPSIACYGKLPLHDEFLRVGVSAPVIERLVGLLDATHHLLADLAEPPSFNRELRALFTFDGGQSAVAALVQQSCDAFGRRYPIGVYVHYDTRALRDRWYLAPLWLRPLWPRLAEQLAPGAATGPEEFEAGLIATDCSLDDLDVIEEQFSAATSAPIEKPWSTLIGAEQPLAGAMAHTFLALSEAQEQSPAGDGIVMRCPTNPPTAQVSGNKSFETNPPPAQAEPVEASFRKKSTVTVEGAALAAVQSSLWVRLFAAFGAASRPWPALIEVHQPGATSAESICIFGRAPSPQDLAYLLANVGVAAIDDVGQAWEDNRVSERVQRRVAALLDERPRAVAELWTSVE